MKKLLIAIGLTLIIVLLSFAAREILFHFSGIHKARHVMIINERP